MFWVYAFMLVLVCGIVVTLIWWGLARWPGSEVVELTMHIVTTSQDLARDAVKLREMLDGRPALLIEPSDPRLQEAHAILAGTNEYEVFPYRQGLRDHGSILLGLANSSGVVRIGPEAEESIAAIATRSKNVEHLNVILTIVPGSLVVRPGSQRVRVFTLSYHRISLDISDIRFA